MKLLVAVITFAATLGVLFLIETGKSTKQDYAQIIEALKNENINAAVSATPSQIKNKLQAPTLTPILTPISSPTLTLSPTQIFSPTPPPTPTLIQTFSPQPTLTPSPTATLTLTPTPTPTGTSTPATGHIFYTSSYRTAKYYYCDTDNGWKNLSPDYLKSYPSEEELLRNYPSRILHEPCK